MNKKEHINKLIDEALNSVDNVGRAVPQPFLLTRVNARLSRSKENTWEKMVRFIGRPAVAITGLAMLVLINVTAIVFNRTDSFTSISEQVMQAPPDEFSYAVSTIYDIENTEP